MNSVRASFAILLLFTVTLWGAGPGEEYVRIYSLIQKGETLERTDHETEALAAYLDAQKGLSRLQKTSPDWNAQVVNFRLRFVQSKIDQLSPQVSVQSNAPLTSATPSAPPNVAQPAANAAELAQLRGELQQLRSENSALQAKLREALSIRPAAVDPKELEAAQQRNQELAAEIEALKASLELAQEQSRNADAENQRAQELAAEVVRLNTQVASLRTTANNSEALRAENDLLRSQLETLLSQDSSLESETGQMRLDEALAELTVLRSEADILRLEKSALENRVQQLRDQMSKPAFAATRPLVTATPGVDESVNPLTTQEIERLRARLAVYEAEKIPYSVEELVLMRMSQASLVAESSRPKPPAGVGPLVAQAETAFKQGRFEEAEQALKQILASDETNAFTLANLAATQMEQGRDAEAEVNLRKALVSSPIDPFTLATMGILQFRQEQYDEALDYLGLAAKYDPNNAVVQNYLGMTLSEKGMRGPAETALRRAIQLNSNFADAHFNLALVYILQDPPMRELARWHYQKSLGLGHERSPELEQLLDKRGVN